MQEVERLTNGALHMGPGTLYGTIKRMLAAGLIEEADERPDPVLDDERRRYYRATHLGIAVLDAETARMATLVSAARAKRIARDDGRWFVRVYGCLLWLYPPALRREHGLEMSQWVRTTINHRGRLAALCILAAAPASAATEWLRLLDVPTGASMIGIGRDVTYAFRLLRRSPGFSAAAMVTLALGIGANAAVFSLAEGTVLRPIMVAHLDDLYSVRWASTYPDYLSYAERRDLFDGVVASSGGRASVTANGSSEIVEAYFVSGNYFDVLGVPPPAGRVISPDDDRRNGPVVGVMSDTWWRTRFGADRGVIGTQSASMPFR